MKQLFSINPAIDRTKLAAIYAAESRVQIRNFLTPETAGALAKVLTNDTAYDFVYLGTDGAPQRIAHTQLTQKPVAERTRIAASVNEAARAGDYAVRFNSYPILDAYLAGEALDGPHAILMEHLNAAPFLELVRAVTGIGELIKADAQATVFAPGDFLSLHSDSHVAEGWRVAYVLNLAEPADWKPDWGGYLNFFDADGDIVAGWRPRFNALNLFAVPQPHNVSFVPPFAPAGRFAITGWLRDR